MTKPKMTIQRVGSWHSPGVNFYAKVRSYEIAAEEVHVAEISVELPGRVSAVIYSALPYSDCDYALNSAKEQLESLIESLKLKYKRREHETYTG